MDNLEKLIKSETNYMFSDAFYLKFTKKVVDFISENKHNTGFVYFIKNGQNSNRVKIGLAIDIDKRISSYQTSFYNNIFILGYIKAEKYIFLEKEIHSFFSDKRIKGEWFELDNLDLFNLKESYEYIPINDFYNKKIKIKDMKEKEIISDFQEVIDFCKSLSLNKKYTTKRLLFIYNEKHPDKAFKNTSWFGRELSKSFKILGINKIDSTAKGIRSFTLK